ncbi:PASTA domain-containing protein [Paenibacillus sp. MBLB4367]|uniref:PASTA domain-containing protein n=1 Tax=Paenibacillus sp. MBLB4367 TaxID=3384767 RepID=UPI0039080794
MKPISNRYELKDLIAPLNGGQLYTGKDMSLMRLVFLYEIPVRQGVVIEPYIQKIGKAMQESTHTQFLHILDVEFGEEQVRIVLTYREGVMFRQFARQHTLTFREAVGMIIQFGRILLEAAEERSMEFSLKAGNVWITDDHKINVINSWDRPVDHQRLSKELLVLLVQLVSRTAEEPTDGQWVEAELRRHLRDMPASSREAVVSTFMNAWNGRLSLNAFIQNLHHLLQGAKEGGRSVDRSERVVNGERVQRAERVERAEPHRVQRVPAMSEPKRPVPAVEDEDAADTIEEADREKTPVKRRLYRLSKRLWQGLGLAALTIAVFIGVFTMLIQSTDGKGKQTGPAATASGDRQSPQPSASASAKPSQDTSKPPSKEPSKQPSPSPSPSSGSQGETTGPVHVPNLNGMTREAAEKTVLATGLRYSFIIEVNEKAAGTVFKQEPAASEIVSKGDRITFWISKGPQ